METSVCIAHSFLSVIQNSDSRVAIISGRDEEYVGGGASIGPQARVYGHLVRVIVGGVVVQKG